MTTKRDLFNRYWAEMKLGIQVALGILLFIAVLNFVEGDISMGFMNLSIFFALAFVEFQDMIIRDQRATINQLVTEDIRSLITLDPDEEEGTK